MRLIGLTCAALVMLAACSGEPTPIEPTSKPSPTKPASSAGGTSSLEPPKLPAAAKRNDETGAANFVLYWVKAFNYAARTGDTELLREVSEAGCAGLQRTSIWLRNDVFAKGDLFPVAPSKRHVNESGLEGYLVTADVVPRRTLRAARRRKAEKSSAEERRCWISPSLTASGWNVGDDDVGWPAHEGVHGLSRHVRL